MKNKTSVNGIVYRIIVFFLIVFDAIIFAVAYWGLKKNNLTLRRQFTVSSEITRV